VLDVHDAPAGGASGLPAGVLVPHVSPDDSLLSRLSRCGVRATLQQAGELLPPRALTACSLLPPKGVLFVLGRPGEKTLAPTLVCSL